MSRLTKVLLYLLATTVFLTAALLFCRGGIIEPSISPLTTNSLTSPTASQETISLDHQNWKTFKSENFGFEFRYPPEYSLRREGVKVFLEKKDSGSLLYLKVIDNPENLSARQWFENQCPCKTEPLMKTHTFSELTTNGLQVLKLVQKQPPKYHDIKIIASAKQKIFFFNFSPEVEKAQLADQIFATFKLLD